LLPNSAYSFLTHNTTANPYCFVQANGRTALHFAAGWGQVVVTQQLLNERCDVDLIDKAGMSRCLCLLKYI
jgi:hypothetical protein